MDSDIEIYIHATLQRGLPLCNSCTFSAWAPTTTHYSPNSALELVRLMQTCRSIYYLVLASCFSLHRLLSTFFGDATQVDAFRAMQGRTGTIVSGSTVLQFFNRRTWEGSDLDVYVDRPGAALAAFFIVETGYTFNPRKSQEKTVSAQLVQSIKDRAPSYLGRGIADVLDFHKGDKKIQLIVAATTPMEIILSFHSTCVMNIITHDRAITLYPESTFRTKQALIVETVGTRQEAGRQKYIDRGWTMMPSPCLDNANELGVRMPRSFDDKFTWTIPLPPLFSIDSDTKDLGPIASFQLECSRGTTSMSWKSRPCSPSDTGSEDMSSTAHEIATLRRQMLHITKSLRRRNRGRGRKHDDTFDIDMELNSDGASDADAGQRVRWAGKRKVSPKAAPSAKRTRTRRNSNSRSPCWRSTSRSANCIIQSDAEDGGVGAGSGAGDLLDDWDLGTPFTRRVQALRDQKGTPDSVQTPRRARDHSSSPTRRFARIRSPSSPQLLSMNRSPLFSPSPSLSLSPPSHPANDRGVREGAGSGAVATYLSRSQLNGGESSLAGPSRVRRQSSLRYREGYGDFQAGFTGSGMNYGVGRGKTGYALRFEGFHTPKK
ncbi:hypothetical protein B0H19DRAFT_1122167 [Mycena capillaripes]|nr:hypothetical protein B0H19DRAFT_1122167 [Mycena capillaripes]